MRIAIAGATGAVGQDLIKLLEQRNFPVKDLRLLASAASVGKKLLFRGQELMVKELTHDSFQEIDIAFFSCGASRSLEFCPAAVNAGAIVIDNSSAFRMDQNVPLVVPEVNPQDLQWHHGIIANPNCTTIQMVVALKPIHDFATIKRVVVATYQSVSGTGAKAIEELNQQIQQIAAKEEVTKNVYPAQIAFNVIPHVDIFMENGYTKEEMKMVHETRKIMGDQNIQVSATCVRVPVIRAHSEAINIETERKVTVEKAREIWSNAPGIIVASENHAYHTPLEIAQKYETYVSRIREDLSVEKGLAFWVVADQLYKGAALNAVQIAECLK